MKYKIQYELIVTEEIDTNLDPHAVDDYVGSSSDDFFDKIHEYIHASIEKMEKTGNLNIDMDDGLKVVAYEDEYGEHIIYGKNWYPWW